jgi:peptidoglycan/LPS O-acetylase OafA/YrhL
MPDQKSALFPSAASGSEVTGRHFATIDVFRFFAFLKVFLQHIPIVSFAAFNLLRAGGVIGVQFFFTLSGFLITYITLNEQKQSGNFNLMHFFIRRILRIWPLFFLIVGISYSIPLLLRLIHLPKVDSGYHPVWWQSLLFLENYKMIFTHQLPVMPELAITWSLCVEEHFYIIWGLLLWLFPAKKLPFIVVACIAVAWISRLIFFHYNLDPSDVFTNLDLFALGSVPAYLLLFHPQKTNAVINHTGPLFRKWYMLFVVVFVVAAAQIKDIIACNLWLTTVSGIIFSGLIFMTLADRSSQNRTILTKAGTYTYGMYMYHVMMVTLLVRITTYFHLTIELPLNAFLFTIIALAGTLLISIFSYKVFERPFLRLKKLFR